MGPVSTDVHDFRLFSNKLSWLAGPLFIVFSAQPSQGRLFEVVGRDQKDARRKVTQIRGGITSGSALFDLFVAMNMSR